MRESMPRLFAKAFEHLRWFYIHVRLFRDFWRIYLGSPKSLTLWNGVVFHFEDRKQIVPILYEVWTQKVYSQLSDLQPDAVIVDVGAHIGSFTIFAARKYPEATIYAFEPEPINFRTLSKNVAANGISNCILINKAVSDSEGIIKLVVGAPNSGTHSVFKREGNAVDVACTTIPNFMAEYRIEQIDFLKLDCEGCEPLIAKTLPPTVKKVIAEWPEDIALPPNILAAPRVT